MGVFSPVPSLTKRIQKQVEQRVVVPSVHALRREEIPFRGVLYAGLMMTEAGPRVLEFNTRFGDPETQAVLPRLRTDLAGLMLDAARPGGLNGTPALEWDPRQAVTVVLAAAGYPDNPRTGDPITGLEGLAPEIEVAHAGTAERDGVLVTAGGRVLSVTALAETPAQARAAAYAAADAIAFDGKQVRRDIALRAEERTA
jgi:phosphoribosylamine--glycine ligase